MITNRLDEFPDDLSSHDLSGKGEAHYSAVYKEWVAEALDGHMVYGQTYDACNWNVREANRAIRKQRETERETEKEQTSICRLRNLNLRGDISYMVGYEDGNAYRVCARSEEEARKKANIVYTILIAEFDAVREGRC